MESRLYIGNLSDNSSEKDLHDLFSQAGAIQEVNVVRDRYSGQPKGFGFVQMVDPADAQKAIRMFNDQDLDGQRLIVSIAHPREQGGSSGYRRGPNHHAGGRRRR